VALLRALGPRDAGLVLFVYTTLTVAANVALFGGNTLAMREAARDAKRAGQAIRHATTLTLILSPLVAICLSLAIVYQGRGTTSFLLAALGGVTVVPCALSTLYGSALRGMGRVGAGTMAEVGLAVWVAAIGMALLLLTGSATPLRGVVLLLLGNVFSLAWSATVVLRQMPSVRIASKDLRKFVRENAHSLTSFLTTSLGSYLLPWLPVIVLGYVARDAASAQENVALYNAAARPAQFVSLVALIQAPYLGPRFAKMFHLGQLWGISSLSRRSLRWASAWACLFTGVTLVRPEMVLSIFGQYGSAATSLTILAMGTLIVVLIGPVTQIMLVTGLETRARLYTIVALASAALALPILSLWGIAAVACGAAASSIGYAVACWIRLSRERIEAGPVRLSRQEGSTTSSPR
jgi:O-antigen/teichoic acid export membrane protein